MDILPNQTIYIQNLYEKLNKEELKKCLHAVFSQFGRILDIICLKTYRLRGQAWIVFSDVAAATNALRTMNGFPFFDKPMRVHYAKSKSDIVAKLDGSYKNQDKKERSKKNAAARETMIKRGQEKQAAAASGHGGAKVGPDGQAPPNKILFVQNLPEQTNDMMLSMLFQQFPGFREVRMVEARPGIAFVEFENEMQASVALSGLQNFQITPTHAMTISYAKQ